MRSPLSCFTLAFAVLLPAGAIRAQDARLVNPANMDTTCAACTDFYEYANGGWLKTATIPPTRTSVSSFSTLSDHNTDDRPQGDGGRFGRGGPRDGTRQLRTVEDRHVLHGVHGHGRHRRSGDQATSADARSDRRHSFVR